MRVLHVTHQYAPAIGGAERYIIDISEELARRDHQVTVYTSRSRDYHTWRNELPPQETINGVDVRRFWAIPRRGHTWRALETGLRHYWPGRSPIYSPLIFYGNGPIMPGLFAAVLRQAHHFDLLHISQLHYAHAATAYTAARLAGLPTVITPHMHAEQRVTYDVDYLHRILNGSAIIFADTAGERNFLIGQGHHPLKVVTGGHGLNMRHFPPQDPKRSRARFGLPDDAFVVLFLGRKTAYKGLAPTVAAFGAFQAQHPNAYLLAVGPETDESARLWQQVGDVPNLIVRGTVEDDERLAALAACDVLLLPSTGEAFGIVYLEAWAYGKPVIGAPITAVSALISDGVDGWLIAPDDVPAITARLAWLATHPDAARAAGASGRDKLLRRYTTERIVDGVEAAYVRALRRSRSTAIRYP